MKIEQLFSMDGYTFDEGIAFLRLCQAPEGVVMHIATTHNRSHLHSEIHKMLRMPGTMRLLQEKGFGREEVPPVQESNESAPKSNESVPKSNESVPKSNENETKSDDKEPESDDTEINLTIEDVRKHENTRLEDMPNDLCRTLWLKRQEVYREMQQAHLKMRSVPEGEEHNEERAHWRAEVLRLDAENDSYWQQIDAEIERLKTEAAKPVEEPKQQTPSFDVSTYRAYISKALRKKKLTPAQLAELQHRVDAILDAQVEIKPETLDKLKAIGIKIG
jgi:hypothetical protein